MLVGSVGVGCVMVVFPVVSVVAAVAASTRGASGCVDMSLASVVPLSWPVLAQKC